MAGRRNGVLVEEIAWTKRWGFEKIVVMGMGMLWMVDVPGHKMERLEMTLEGGQAQVVKYLIYC